MVAGNVPMLENSSSQVAVSDAPCPVPYTQVHSCLRRAFENLQDIVISLLLVLLVLLSLQALWQLARMAFIGAAPSRRYCQNPLHTHPHRGLSPLDLLSPGAPDLGCPHS